MTKIKLEGSLFELFIDKKGFFVYLHSNITPKYRLVLL